MPHIIPDIGWDSYGSSAWADVAVVVPYWVYRTYGDTEIIKDQFESMKKWIALGFAMIAAMVLLLLPNEPKKQYFHHQGNIFGTYYNIRYEGKEDLHQEIKQRLQEVDGSLSMFNPNSVISKINRNDSVITDSLFETMFSEAHTISELSDGAFDITIKPICKLWDIGGENQRIPTQEEIDSVLPLVNYKKVSFSKDNVVMEQGMELELGAIAKGYAADEACRILKEAGIPKCLTLWRMADSYHATHDSFNFFLCTGKTEYIFSIKKKDTNIYCGASYNIVFDLGVFSGGQFFRIRNYRDNSEKWCRFHCDFSHELRDIKIPTEQCELGKCLVTTKGLMWCVKRYTDDEIVLQGCGDDDYTYRRTDKRTEQFSTI